jgi:NAD(P)H-hydrate repair Nnr-like enzyme with NAD(P)H-hydrate dehydratase domain
MHSHTPQIPVAAAVEAVIGHPAWLSSGAAAAMTLGGTGLIMAGFVAGNLADRGAKVAGSHHRGEGE